MDDDSEAEKLSPLLVTDEGSPDLNLRMNVAEDSVDDTDDVRTVKAFSRLFDNQVFFQDKATMMAEGSEAKADDSDYYTPEDPHTNILSPVKSERPIEKVNFDAYLMTGKLIFFPLEGHCDTVGCY